jgi:tRNA pseudouridine55 synthase
VRRVLGERSIGHTGTLDPFATGLLVLLSGRATRLARFVEPQFKTYTATAKLGFSTTTDDLTGEMVAPEQSVEGLTAERIVSALKSMIGPHQQTPPAFSAKKVAGERSYRKARRGEAVELAAVEIMVREIELMSFQPPLITFRAEVSAGTYIRAMARDLGQRLGVGAHLTALRRDAIGVIRVEQAIPLESVRATTPLTPLRTVLGHMVAVEVDSQEIAEIVHGRAIRREPAGTSLVLLVRNDDVIGVGREDGEWLRPMVVLEGA